MAAGIELKYIIMFAILIALTGFTFESQQTREDNKLSSLSEVSQINKSTNSQVSTLSEQFTQP